MNYFSLLLNLYKLKRNTYKSREQIKRLQDKKLKQILKYAYRHSKYYNKSFKKAGITEENIDTLPLHLFPTVDKSVLMKHFDELVTTSDLKQKELRKFDERESVEKSIFKNKYHLVHSSGSTGKPVYFVYDDNAWNQMLLGIIRAALWDMSMLQILKLLAQKPKIMYIAATDGRYGGAMAVGDGIKGIHASQLFIDINAPLTQWKQSIKKFKPNIIIGYPSAIKILGELVEKEKIKLDVSRIISCGEPIGTGLRKYIEKVFHTDLINIYGASESLALGVETNQEEGMILFDDMNYIEVEDGTMYLTCLYNYVQPLIRYKISDKLVLKQTDKNSKYPFTKAENILGRNEDLMWFEDKHGNKEFLHPLAIEGFCIEGLVDYQFIQTSSNSFEMLAEISDINKQKNIQCEISNQMRKILDSKNLDYVQFYIEFVDEILPDAKTGKKQLIVTATDEIRSII